MTRPRSIPPMSFAIAPPESPMPRKSQPAPGYIVKARYKVPKAVDVYDRVLRDTGDVAKARAAAMEAQGQEQRRQAASVLTPDERRLQDLIAKSRSRAGGAPLPDDDLQRRIEQREARLRKEAADAISTKGRGGFDDYVRRNSQYREPLRDLRPPAGSTKPVPKEARAVSQQELYEYQRSRTRPPERDEAELSRPRLYFAYGSNLSVDQMQYRCPGSTPLYKHLLVGYKLVFRRVADIVYTGLDTDSVPGVIWRVSGRDERELDKFEGVRSGVYRKESFQYRDKWRNWHPVLFYAMNKTTLESPTAAYLGRILKGYERFALDKRYLDKALAEARAEGA